MTVDAQYIMDSDGVDFGVERQGNRPVVVANIDTGDSAVGVQNPFPTDGDSIYVKDLDLTISDNGDFSGSVTDYFDSLISFNSNVTSDNPKIIKLSQLYKILDTISCKVEF